METTNSYKNKNGLLLTFMEFEGYLKDTLPKNESIHPHYNDAIAHTLLAGGKRFRPKLLLSVIDAFNKLLIHNSMPIALALEYLHTYSLIHDDLPAMDNATLRRGSETLHKKFDETTAILVGDALNTHSFNLIANAPLSSDTKIELIKELSINGGMEGMVLGQAIDCFFEKQKLSITDLEFLHKNKTGKLIATSLKMGAIITDLDKSFQQKIFDFGLKLGLLFQVNDDIIDTTSSEKVAGKNIKADTHKNSFVNLLGLERAEAKKNNLIRSLREDLSTFNPHLESNLTFLLNKYLS